MNDILSLFLPCVCRQIIGKCKLDKREVEKVKVLVFFFFWAVSIDKGNIQTTVQP